MEVIFSILETFLKLKNNQRGEELGHGDGDDKLKHRKVKACIGW